jgi:hypothetical protein
MFVNMIVRRKGDERDARLALLRKEGIPLLKKHGAVSHRYGFYHSGPHAGQILIVIGYQDIATHERAMQSMSKDEDWKRIAGEVEKIAPLQEKLRDCHYERAVTGCLTQPVALQKMRKALARRRWT